MPINSLNQYFLNGLHFSPYWGISRQCNIHIQHLIFYIYSFVQSEALFNQTHSDLIEKCAEENLDKAQAILQNDNELNGADLIILGLDFFIFLGHDQSTIDELLTLYRKYKFNFEAIQKEIQQTDIPEDHLASVIKALNQVNIA